MKLSQDAKDSLAKLPQEQQQKVIKLVAQKLALNELQRRMDEQNSASKGKPQTT